MGHLTLHGNDSLNNDDLDDDDDPDEIINSRAVKYAFHNQTFCFSR